MLAVTASTPMRKDTGVLESFGHFLLSCFIGLKCPNYALSLFYIHNILLYFIYIYIHIRIYAHVYTHVLMYICTYICNDIHAYISY